MKRLTCLTFSKEPFQREVPLDCEYLNYNSVFSDHSGLIVAYKEAINKIQTQDFFICDYDDPLPESLPEFKTGMIYGDFYYTSIFKDRPNINRHLISDHWNSDLHLNRWFLIHKPILKTEYVKSILPYIEVHRFINVQHVIHFLVAMIYGSTYDPNFVVRWNKYETGLHSIDYKELPTFTKQWLLDNKDKIYREIKSRL